MQAGDWDEEAFFTASATSGARVLLIGRQAMIALGLPVSTAGFELWGHIDDIDPRNAPPAPAAK